SYLQTTTARSRPRASTAAANVASSRCGDSKNTVVRGSAASLRSHLLRSPGLRGAKPSKQNCWEASPDTASADVTADGPGRHPTGSPSATHAVTSRYPGSDTLGIPASVS